MIVMEWNTIVEDVLLYLPAWTTKPKKNRQQVNAYMEDNEFKIFPEKEDTSEKEYYEDLNIRKHITESEIIRTYHVAKTMADILPAYSMAIYTSRTD